MKSSFRGGFRIGKGLFSSINATYPFAKLRIEDKIYLELGFWIFKKIYVFELDEVLVKVGVLFLGNSIQIVHNNPKYPQYIYFHAFNVENIAFSLKSKGVLIKEYTKISRQKICNKALKLYISIFLIVWIAGLMLGLIILARKALGYI